MKLIRFFSICFTLFLLLRVFLLSLRFDGASLTSRKPLWEQNVLTDIQRFWSESGMSAPVVNSHLVADPTIQQSGFDLPWHQWSLLNRFRTAQLGHCGACRKRWRSNRLRTALLWRDADDVSHCRLVSVDNGDGDSSLQMMMRCTVQWLANLGRWIRTRTEDGKPNMFRLTNLHWLNTNGHWEGLIYCPVNSSSAVSSLGRRQQTSAQQERRSQVTSTHTHTHTHSEWVTTDHHTHTSAPVQSASFGNLPTSPT